MKIKYRVKKKASNQEIVIQLNELRARAKYNKKKRRNKTNS